MNKLIFALLIIWIYTVFTVHNTASATATTATSTDVTITHTVEKFDVDIKFHELAVKYGVNEASARAIIKCESKWNPKAVHYNYRADGTLWSKDIGYWQLNDYYWKAEMAKMGWDIYDPSDNLEAGFWLYSKSGPTPWAWSNPCHHQLN